MTILQPSNTYIDLYRTRKVQIVLFSGKALSGKTTAANLIAHNLCLFPGISVKHTALAQPIKDLASREFGWDGIKDSKGRRLLQVIGTDAGREYDVDLWVRKLEDIILSDMNPPNFVLIDDWRYTNERDFFVDKFFYEVTTVRIERPGAGLDGANAAHISEISLPSAEKETLVYNLDTYYNFAIQNDMDIGEFQNKLNNIYLYLASKVVPFKEV